MNYNIIGAAVAALIGALVAFVNFLISKNILIKHPEKYAFTTVFRQIIQVVFLVIVYFVCNKTELDLLYLLTGAVLGMTLPMLYFTKKLVSVNEAVNKKTTVKEDDPDG